MLQGGVADCLLVLFLVRERRKTTLLKSAGGESLALAVELFNRPFRTARDSAVLMLLGHAFEMLLKAAIYQKRGRIRDPNDSTSYGFARTINIAFSDLQAFDEDDLTILRAIKQHRDAATHDTIALSDDLLWLHIRSAVTVFGRILDRQFSSQLTDLIPARVVPVAAIPPSDAVAVVERDMQDIAELLAPNTRRGDEARSRLRPLLALDGSVTGREEPPADAEVDRAVRSLRAGRDWKAVFPGLALLTLSEAPAPGSQEVSLRVVRSADGISVRAASPGESALLYRTMDPFQEFNIKLSEFGQKLGVTRHEGYALIWCLELKNDGRAYYIKKTDRGNVVYQGLSARALHLARQALDEDLDVGEAAARYNARSRKAG